MSMELELREEVTALEATVQELAVTDQASLDGASSLLRDIKALIDKIEESQEPVVKAAYAVHQAAVKARDDLQRPLREAMAAVKRKVGSYAEQLRAAEEAKRIAAAKAAQEEAEEEALWHEATGEATKAAEVRVEAAQMPAPRPVTKPIAKAEGLTTGRTWKAQVTDKMELVRAVAAGKVALDALRCDDGWLNAQARNSKGKALIPGVEFYPEARVAVR